MTMTRQEIFNAAYLGLKSQGFERSMRGAPFGGCAYRGAGNRKCAIGHCIPDELYEKSIEGHAIYALPSSIADFLGFSPHDEFLSELQNAHDCGDRPKAMQDSLYYISQRYNLDIPE